MKKLLIVNNHMHIGGVQKALVSLLNEIKDQYDVTLYLFSSNGTCFADIPENVKVRTSKSLYRCFGISQAEAKNAGVFYIFRSILALITKLFGRSAAIALANLSQRKLKDRYDVAISFLHSGDPKSFYGGCNDFVLSKVNAENKITFLHGDYTQCGANHPKTNNMYRKFDFVAACSEGCRQSFLKVLPDMEERCGVVPNCHSYEKMRTAAKQKTVEYGAGIHVLSIARLTREKGIDRGIRAAACAKENGLQMQYHIVGDGVERKSLEQLAEQLNVEDLVCFHGNQENPYRFLPNADLLLIPSYHEAAPLVIDEAKCFGVPVLSTRTSSAEAMVAQRNLGWVCDQSQSAINEQLLTLLKTPASLQEQKMQIMQMKCDNDSAVSAFHSIMR